LLLAFVVGAAVAAMAYESRAARSSVPAGVPESIELVRPPVTPAPLVVRLRVVAVDAGGRYVPVAESSDAALWKVTTERAGERTTVYGQAE
jgi:hypothetical protein